jgi:hypothetical protein
MLLGVKPRERRQPPCRYGFGTRALAAQLSVTVVRRAVEGARITPYAYHYRCVQHGLGMAYDPRS